jgi:hypothetical protein
LAVHEVAVSTANDRRFDAETQSVR